MHTLKPYSSYTDRSNYLGETQNDFLIALVGNDMIFDANEEEIVKRFTAAGLIEDTNFIRTSIGNFCGPPTNFLLIHEFCMVGIEIAENAKNEISDYPVLDDDIFSRLETAETERRWNDNYDDETRAELSLELLGEALTDWDDIVAHPEFSQLQENIMLD